MGDQWGFTWDSSPLKHTIYEKTKVQTYDYTLIGPVYECPNDIGPVYECPNDRRYDYAIKDEIYSC